MRKDLEYTTTELMQQAVAWQVERCGEACRTACLEALESRADADEQFAALLREALARAESVQDWAEDEQLSVLELAGVAESIPVLTIPPELLAQAMHSRLPAGGELSERMDAYVRMCEEIPFADEYKKYTLSVYEAKKLVLRRLSADAVRKLESTCAALEAKIVEQESQLGDLRASVDGSEQLRRQLEELERRLREKDEEIEVLTEMIEEHDARGAQDAKNLHEMRSALSAAAAQPARPEKKGYTNMQPDPPRHTPRAFTNMQPEPPRPAPRAFTNMQPSALQPAVSAPEDGEVMPPSEPTRRRYPKPSDFRRLMEDPTVAQSRRKRRSRDFLDEADKAIDRQKRAEAKAKQGGTA